MTEYMAKAQLLNDINTTYTELEAILSQLSEEQMTTPGVNGVWSVKDNIAHLDAWLAVTLDRVQAMRDNVKYSNPWAGMEDDVVNEEFYQQNKSRALDEVLSKFRLSHQKLVEQTEELSEEELNRPLSNGYPIWQSIVGSASEHYQDHIRILQDWLARQ